MVLTVLVFIFIRAKGSRFSLKLFKPSKIKQKYIDTIKVILIYKICDILLKGAKNENKKIF